MPATPALGRRQIKDGDGGHGGLRRLARGRLLAAHTLRVWMAKHVRSWTSEAISRTPAGYSPALAAVSITLATASGWERKTAWLAATSVTFALERL